MARPSRLSGRPGRPPLQDDEMDRDSFLKNIATKLGRVPGSPPAARGAVGVPEFHSARPSPDREGLVEKFCLECAAVAGQVRKVEGLPETHLALKAVLEEWKVGSLVSWSRQEFEGWELGWLWDRCLAWEPGSSAPEFREACFNSQAGLTAADFGVAESGSLVFTASPGRPRSVSLLPGLHLALLKASQLRMRMGQALERLMDGPRGTASLVQFVTGPSRTSDIENDLTIGVHGPAAVVVILRVDS